MASLGTSPRSYTGAGAALSLPFISFHVFLCGPCGWSLEWERILGPGEPLSVEAPERLLGGGLSV